MAGAAHLNGHIDQDAEEGPAVLVEGKVHSYISNSTEGVKVAARCERCVPGKTHYRIATPKTLSKKDALYCKMCPAAARPPAPAGVRMPYATEQSFIDVLSELGVDEEFVYQVVPDFWGQCMDFYNYAADYFVQVDGSCHWKGMYQHKCEEVLGLDFSQAHSAVVSEAKLVRIHEADLSNVDVVQKTLEVAKGFTGVVLSPSYACQWVPCQGGMVLYTQALLWQYPNLAQNPGPDGVLLIHPK
jgi:hypothetical protein